MAQCDPAVQAALAERPANRKKSPIAPSPPSPGQDQSTAEAGRRRAFLRAAGVKRLSYSATAPGAETWSTIAESLLQVFDHARGR